MARNDLRIEVEGVRDLQRALREIDRALPRQLRKANLSAAELVVDEALPDVPVRTGRLKGTVRAGATQRSAEARAGSETRVPYAAPVHWGWPKRNIRAQPFLQDALGRARGDVVRRYEREVERLLDIVRRGV